MENHSIGSHENFQEQLRCGMCRCVLQLILLLLKICHTFDLWVAGSYLYLFLFLIRARKEAPLWDMCHHCQNLKSKDTEFLPLLTPSSTDALPRPNILQISLLSLYPCIFHSLARTSSLSLSLSLNVLAGSLHLYWNQLHESSGICWLSSGEILESLTLQIRQRSSGKPDAFFCLKELKCNEAS